MKIQNIRTLLFSSLLLCVALTANAQDSKWSLKADYGIQKSFMVLLSNEYADKEHDSFNRKDVFGFQKSFNVEYKLTNTGFIGGGLSCATNYAIQSYLSSTIKIDDLKTRHWSTFYQLYYKKGLFKSNKLFLQAGMTLCREKIENLSIKNNSISLYKDYIKLVPGILLGAEYYFAKKHNFEIGISSKVYWQIFDGLLDNISVSPVVKYNF
jgi:hypothetical protein